jgi:hypothetical protein
VVGSVVLGAYEIHDQVDLGYYDATEGYGEEEKGRQEPKYLFMSDRRTLAYAAACWTYRRPVPPGKAFEVCLSRPFQLTAPSRATAGRTAIVLRRRTQQRRVFGLVGFIIRLQWHEDRRFGLRLRGLITRAEILVYVDVLDKGCIHV